MLKVQLAGKSNEMNTRHNRNIRLPQHCHMYLSPVSIQSVYMLKSKKKIFQKKETKTKKERIRDQSKEESEGEGDKWRKNFYANRSNVHIGCVCVLPYLYNGLTSASLPSFPPSPSLYLSIYLSPSLSQFFALSSPSYCGSDFTSYNGIHISICVVRMLFYSVSTMCTYSIHGIFCMM